MHDTVHDVISEHYHISVIIWYNEQKWKRPVDDQEASLADSSLLLFDGISGNFASYMVLTRKERKNNDGRPTCSSSG